MGNVMDSKTSLRNTYVRRLRSLYLVFTLPGYVAMHGKHLINLLIRCERKYVSTYVFVDFISNTNLMCECSRNQFKLRLYISLEKGKTYVKKRL